MKKILAILIAFLMTISLSACETKPVPSQDTSQDTESNIDTNITQTPEEVPEVKITADDFVGPWYLDSKNNDLDKFSDLFPGYGEWGATMEVRSDGKISWYIGVVGGSGTYTLVEDQLTADLKQATKNTASGPQDWTVEFKVAVADEDVTLTMIYEDVSVVWSRGETPDTDAEEWKTDFEASLLERYGVTPDRYEHLGDGIYQVYVTIEGNSVPYVTVDSATGEYHG